MRDFDITHEDLQQLEVIMPCEFDNAYYQGQQLNASTKSQPIEDEQEYAHEMWVEAISTPVRERRQL